MISQIDELWFRVHPERLYRLRRISSAEILVRETLFPPFHTVWVIILVSPH